MNKLLILLFGITVLFPSFDGCFIGIEGRYEYNTYSSSLSSDKNVSVTSKNKFHSKLIPAIFVGRNHIFGKNYFGYELKIIGPTSQKNKFPYEEDEINIVFQRGLSSLLSLKAGTFILDKQTIYLKPSLLVSKYTSKNGFSSSKRKIKFIPIIGTEIGITDKIFLRFEYEYHSLTPIRYANDGITHNHTAKSHVGIMGVSYKF